MQTERLLRLPQVCEITSLSKPEIYRRVSKGTFPKQIRISHKVAAWRAGEIEQWVQQVANAA